MQFHCSASAFGTTTRVQLLRSRRRAWLRGRAQRRRRSSSDSNEILYVTHKHWKVISLYTRVFCCCPFLHGPVGRRTLPLSEHNHYLVRLLRPLPAVFTFLRAETVLSSVGQLIILELWRYIYPGRHRGPIQYNGTINQSGLQITTHVDNAFIKEFRGYFDPTLLPRNKSR